MNFVRFIKTPRIDAKKSQVKGTAKKPYNSQLSMILTITNDFSPFAGHAKLLCELISLDNVVLAADNVQWTQTSREIKVDFPIRFRSKEVRVSVRPASLDRERQSETFLSMFLGAATNHVVGVKTATFPFDTSSKLDTVYRQFELPRGPLQIAEQVGETIIRHVWDAGIILSAALTCDPISFLPDELQQLIHPGFMLEPPVRVLELGSGVGILGVSIAATFPNVKVVMTDLLDAQPLVDENIRLNMQYPHLTRNASFRILDWEQRPFSEWTETEKFDLIVMADVTYNTATFIALVDTLEHLLRTGSRGGKVICCGKRRHDEEERFWSLIRERGFVIQERIIFGMDLNGILRYCGDGRKREGEQMIDFIMMSLK
jgi:2-polyprenyl-3-methyl-5-hydroxy-6-metoxy-1,4-benzoquinol methylase